MKTVCYPLPLPRPVKAEHKFRDARSALFTVGNDAVCVTLENGPVLDAPATIFAFELEWAEWDHLVARVQEARVQRAENDRLERASGLNVVGPPFLYPVGAK